jgi:hypothetical protein
VKELEELLERYEKKIIELSEENKILKEKES